MQQMKEVVVPILEETMEELQKSSLTEQEALQHRADSKSLQQTR